MPRFSSGSHRPFARRPSSPRFRARRARRRTIRRRLKKSISGGSSSGIRFSRHEDVACASCHHPDFGYAESRPLDWSARARLGAGRRFDRPGTRPFVKRNSQTVLNAAFNGIDGAAARSGARADLVGRARRRDLEAQALKAVEGARRDSAAVYPEAAASTASSRSLRAIPDYHVRSRRRLADRRP